MFALEMIAWGGFGLIFGSFANVLVLRFGKGTLGGTLTGRSMCPHCKKVLTWYELVPVVSWLVQKGRCRGCHKNISVQYPIVESLMALGFLALGFAPLPLLVRIIGCAIIFFLIAIAVIDVREMIMPDLWVGAFALLSLFSAYLFPPPAVFFGEWLSSSAILLFSGPFVALPLFALWALSKGTWMGFGDVKFALGMGWLLGIWYGIVALTLSFMLGAVIGVCVLLPLPRIVAFLKRIGITSLDSSGSAYTMKSEVPFGPFLILGTCIVWFSILYAFEPVLAFPAALLFWSSWL